MGNKTTRKRSTTKVSSAHNINNMTVRFNCDDPLACTQNIPLTRTIPSSLAIDTLSINVYSRIFGENLCYLYSNFHTLFGTNKFIRKINTYEVNLINPLSKLFFCERSVIFDLINYIVLDANSKIKVNGRYNFYTLRNNCKFEVLLTIDDLKSTVEEQLPDILFNIYASFTLTEGTIGSLLTSIDTLIPPGEVNISLPLVILPKEMGQEGEDYEQFKKYINQQLAKLLNYLTRRFEMINLEFKLEGQAEEGLPVMVNNILCLLSEFVKDFKFFSCSFWMECNPKGLFEFSVFDSMFENYMKNSRLTDCVLATHFSSIALEGNQVATKEIYDYVMYDKEMNNKMYRVMYCFKKAETLKKLKKKRKVQLTVIQFMLRTDELYKKNRIDYSKNQLRNKRIVPVSLDATKNKNIYFSNQ